MHYVILRADNAYRQKGAYVACVTGTSKKFGLEREFLAGLSPRVTEPGIYETCSVDDKGRKDKSYRVVTHDDAGALVAVRTREATIFELLALGRPVTDLRIIGGSDGGPTFRDSSGALTWRDPPAAPATAPDPMERIAEIAAAANLAGASADALAEALREIAAIARSATGER